MEEQKLSRYEQSGLSAEGQWELQRGKNHHHVWAIVLPFDQAMDGRTLKFFNMNLNVIDEVSRRCLVIWVGRVR